MKDKRTARLRRAKRARRKMRELNATRLCVFRTPRHMYAQVIAPEGDKVLVQASTLDESLRSSPTGNKEAAGKVGSLIASRALEVGVKQVAFDKSGYQYHGRVKALAEAARSGGLEF